MTWHKDYIKSFLANPGLNDAVAYGVRIVKPDPALGRPLWRCIGIHHLTGKENHGQHNVFCDVLDENGQRINGAILVVTNANFRVDHIVIDKPDNEPGTNVPMHFGDTLSIHVSSARPGDKATGFHIRHEDEEAGTTRGHHSFYVVWQRVTGEEPEEPPEEETPEPVEDWRKRFTASRLAVIEECKRYPGGLLTGIITEMAELLDKK
jgi:hypothetical protein